MPIPVLQSLLDKFRLVRGASAAQSIDFDVTGNNAVNSLSAPGNAKGLYFNVTTDASNTAPTVGTCFFRISVLGVQVAEFGVNYVALSFIPTHSTPAAGSNNTASATTAYVRANTGISSYKNIFEREGTHTAGRIAGTYAVPSGDPLPITGTAVAYPWGVFYLDPADFPTVDGLTTKLRLRAQVLVNAVAPSGNYTFGLYPVTTPAGAGAGLTNKTLGTVVTGSTALISSPALNSNNQVASADFAIPAAGYYVIGLVTSGNVAASSHLEIAAQLQLRNA